MIEENEENLENYSSKLTRYPQGSVRELLAISFPLMIALFSGNFMIFFDRLILAHYELDAMNAAAAAGMISMIFSYGLIGIVSITEIFVRQFNGLKKYRQASEAVWQMIWVAFIIWPLYYGLAEHAGPYMLSSYFYDDYGLPYFQWILYFGPSQAIQVALCAFFIGTGRMRLVLLSTFVSNVCNVILDLALIFGIGDILDPMDTKGAAIATGISETIQVLFLLIPFLSKKYRDLYQTHLPTFNPWLLLKCFRMALPGAISSMVEISAWSLMMQLMVSLGSLHATIVTIGLGFYSLIAFGMEGLQKGVTALSFNLIASKKWEELNRMWWSAVKILFAIGSLVGILLVIYPEPLIREFLTVVPENEQSFLLDAIKNTCFFVWIYLILEGLVWISAGVLNAAGDTLFVMVTNAALAWGFALFPIYFFVYQMQGPSNLIWALLNVYAAIHAACFFYRYKSEMWQEDSLLMEYN